MDTSGKKKRLAWLGGIAGVILVAALISVYQILWAPNSFDGDRFITVSKGNNFKQIEDSLVTSGVVRNRFLFNLAARLLQSTRRMQIGRYRFKSGLSNTRILEDLEYGKSAELISVTIPEGRRARRQAAILASNLGIDSTLFMSLVFDTTFVRKLGVDGSSLEGYLMPNTYRFYWQESEDFIVTTMVGTFWSFFHDSLRRRADARGRSLNEVLTLASIIEAETSIDSERARIAGVYENRLKKRMRLQADPTIQYILEDGPRRLTHADLWRESAYNTYRNYGLPPGPIGNPGAACIMAALYPEKHRYYFFVATGEGNHTFSRTYAEHLKAIRRYHRKRAELAQQQGG